MKTFAPVILLMVSLLFGSQSVFAQKIKDVTPAPARVYVFAKPVTGFVDDERPIEDSVKDLQKSLIDEKKGSFFRRKPLIIADSPEHADLTLEVLVSDEVEATPQIETTNTPIFGPLFGDRTSTVKERILPKLVALMRVQGSDYSREFSVQENTAWRYLADSIVEQLDAWIKANWPQLQLIRKEEQN